MGRKVRRVPKGWEHPSNYLGLIPLHDRDYATEARKWLDGFLRWESGEDPDRDRDHDCRYFWDWNGAPPSKESHRPAWSDEERTCYQVYETVTEGTPISPVFDSADEIVVWLMGQGYSEKAARAFVAAGWAPSGIIITEGPQRGVYKDIHAHDLDVMRTKKTEVEG